VAGLQYASTSATEGSAKSGLKKIYKKRKKNMQKRPIIGGKTYYYKRPIKRYRRLCKRAV
jgi:hypothetical protein